MSNSPRTRLRTAANSPAQRSNTMLPNGVELVPTDALEAYARDLRQHSDKQVVQIAGSIREFGFLVPVVVSPDNTIAGLVTGS